MNVIITLPAQSGQSAPTRIECRIMPGSVLQLEFDGANDVRLRCEAPTAAAACAGVKGCEHCRSVFQNHQAAPSATRAEARKAMLSMPIPECLYPVGSVERRMCDMM